MKDDAVLYRAVYVYVIYVTSDDPNNGCEGDYILPQVIHCVGNIIAFRSDQPN